MAGNIHARLGHDSHGIRVQSVGLDPRRVRLDLVAFQVARPALGHLAAAGVAGTEEQDFQHRFCFLHNSSRSILRICFNRLASSRSWGSSASNRDTSAVISLASAGASSSARR